MRTDYGVEIDPARGLLRLRLAGFFDPDTVRQLDIDRREAIVRLGCPPNGHLTLCDISACRLQGQDILAAFSRILAGPGSSRRIAFVTGESAARMQIRRMLTHAGMACFDTIAEAEAWLFDERVERATAA